MKSIKYNIHASICAIFFIVLMFFMGSNRVYAQTDDSNASLIPMFCMYAQDGGIECLDTNQWNDKTYEQRSQDISRLTIFTVTGQQISLENNNGLLALFLEGLYQRHVLKSAYAGLSKVEELLVLASPKLLDIGANNLDFSKFVNALHDTCIANSFQNALISDCNFIEESAVDAGILAAPICVQQPLYDIYVGDNNNKPTVVPYFDISSCTLTIENTSGAWMQVILLAKNETYGDALRRLQYAPWGWNSEMYEWSEHFPDTSYSQSSKIQQDIPGQFLLAPYQSFVIKNIPFGQGDKVYFFASKHSDGASKMNLFDLLVRLYGDITDIKSNGFATEDNIIIDLESGFGAKAFIDSSLGVLDILDDFNMPFLMEKIKTYASLFLSANESNFLNYDESTGEFAVSRGSLFMGVYDLTSALLAVAEDFDQYMLALKLRLQGSSYSRFAKNLEHIKGGYSRFDAAMKSLQKWLVYPVNIIKTTKFIFEREAAADQSVIALSVGGDADDFDKYNIIQDKPLYARMQAHLHVQGNNQYIEIEGKILGANEYMEKAHIFYSVNGNAQTHYLEPISSNDSSSFIRQIDITSNQEFPVYSFTQIHLVVYDSRNLASTVHTYHLDDFVMKRPVFDAAFVSKNSTDQDQVRVMDIGDTETFTLAFKNTGNITWKNFGGVGSPDSPNPHYVELRSVRSDGVVADSFLYQSDWINPQRVGSMKESYVKPGQTAHFEFKGTYPNTIQSNENIYFALYFAGSQKYVFKNQPRVKVQKKDTSEQGSSFEVQSAVQLVSSSTTQSQNNAAAAEVTIQAQAQESVEMTAGDITNLHFEVVNNSTQPFSDQSKIAFYFADEATFEQGFPLAYVQNYKIAETDLQQLQPGESQVVDYDFMMNETLSAGNYYLYAYVDSLNTTDESNEADNLLSLQVVVAAVENQNESTATQQPQSQPDYTTTSDIALDTITLLDEPASQQAFKIHHAVSNTGPNATAGHQVAYYISNNPNELGVELGKVDGQTNYVISTAFIPGLQVGERYEFDHTLRLTQLFPGTNFLTAVLKDQELFADTNPVNNVSKIQFDYQDSEAPQVMNFEVQFGEGIDRDIYKSGKSYSLVGTISDNDTIANISAYVSGNNGETWTSLQENFLNPAYLYSNGTRYNLFEAVVLPTLEPTDEGRIRLVVTDEQGNSSEYVSNAFKVRSHVAAQLTLAEPTAQSQWGIGTDQTIRFTADKSLQLVEAWITYPTHTQSLGAIDPTTRDIVFKIPGKTAYIGSNIRVKLDVLDADYNWSSIESPVFAIVRGDAVIDEKKPVVTIDNPSNGSTLIIDQGAVAVDWSIADASALQDVKIYFQGRPGGLQMLYEGTEKSGHFEIDIAHFEPYSQAKLVVEAIDENDNKVVYMHSLPLDYSAQKKQELRDTYEAQQRALGNLLPNSSFEWIGQNNVAHDWVGGVASKDRVYQGDYALKLTRGQYSVSDYFEIEDVDLPYIFTGKVNTVNNQRYKATAYMYDENHQSIGTWQIVLSPWITSGWRDISAQIPYGFAEATKYVKIQIEGQNSSETYDRSAIYFDDLFFGIDQAEIERRAILEAQKQELQDKENEVKLLRAGNWNQPNLVVNGDFENGMQGFQIEPYSNSSYLTPEVTDDTFLNKQLAFIHTNSTNVGFHKVVSAPIAVESNQEYVFSLKVYGDAQNSGRQAEIIELDSNGVVVNTQEISLVKTFIRPDQQLPFVYYTPREETIFGTRYVPSDLVSSVKIRLRQHESNNLHLRLDDIELKAIAWQPTSEDIQNFETVFVQKQAELLATDTSAPNVTVVSPQNTNAEIDPLIQFQIDLVDVGLGIDFETLNLSWHYADRADIHTMIIDGKIQNKNLTSFQKNGQTFSVFMSPQELFENDKEVVVDIGVADKAGNQFGDQLLFQTASAPIDNFVLQSSQSFDARADITRMADMNRDGIDDLVLVNASKSRVNIVYNGTNLSQGSTIYMQCSSCGSSWSPTDLVITDVDRNGYKDIVYIFGQRVYIYKNTRGSYSRYAQMQTMSVSFHGAKMYVYDADNDGDEDILVLSQKSPYILKNNGSGTYSAESISGPKAEKDNQLYDIDQDGDLDLVQLSHGSVYGTSSTKLYVYENTGLNFVYKGFQQIAYESYSYSPKYYWYTLQVGDFNADGVTDIFAQGAKKGSYDSRTRGYKYNAYVLWYIIDQSFSSLAQKTKISLPYVASEMDVIDFNDDGRLDFVLAGDNSVYMYVQKNNESFEEFFQTSVDQYSQKVATGDFNGDGKNDVMLWGNNYDAQQVPVQRLMNEN